MHSPKQAKASGVMKGRPITTEELDRMLDKVELVVGTDGAPSWRHYLTGMWWSGLRLGESLAFYWDRDDRLCVDMDGKWPMLRIPGEFEKGNKDRLLPIAPEFAELPERTSDGERQGRVFNLAGLRGGSVDDNLYWVPKVGVRIGKATGVKVNTDPKTGKVKYASIHDLRRSLGERWSRRIMPQELTELIRHKSLETKMK